MFQLRCFFIINLLTGYIISEEKMSKIRQKSLGFLLLSQTPEDVADNRGDLQAI
jgi:hypothetical protein